MRSSISTCSFGRGALIPVCLSAILGLGLACGGDDSAPPDSNAGSGDGDTSMPGDGDTSMPGDGDTSMPGDGDTSMPGDGDSSQPAVYGEYSACSDADRVGSFGAGLRKPQAEGQQSFTQVDGEVKDGVTPIMVPVVLMTEGDCSLVETPKLTCTPTCGIGETCNEQLQCVPEPAGQDVGEVTVSGMKDGPLTLTMRRPGRYSETGTLSYPGFDEGATLELKATGAEGPALSLVAEGVAPLSLNEPSITVEAGKSATITWAPPAQAGRSRIVTDLNIALHGGDAPRIVCDTADDGSLEIPEPLITAMFDYNFSGFPAIDMTRQTADSFQGPNGCIEFRGYSYVSRHPVEIPGLASCSVPADCPTGQTCNAELYCE